MSGTLLTLGLAYLVVMMSLLNRKYGNPIVFLLLAPQLMHYSVKPIYLGFQEGKTPILYSDLYELDYAISSLFQELLLLTTLVLIVFITNHIFRRPEKLTKVSETKRRSFAIAVTLTLATFCILLISFGSIVFPANRSVSLTSLNPWLRYIFPFLLFGQVIIVAEIYKSWRNLRHIAVFVGLVSLWLGFSIMNQRGIIVVSVLALLGHSYSSYRISSLKMIFIASFFGVFVIFAKLFNTGSFDATKLALVVEGPDSSALQVWSILMHYVDQFGYDYGSSIFNGLMGIIPHTTRSSIGVLTITDKLNLFYSPNYYLELGFGFNGSLNQSLYLAFGSFAFLAYIPFCAVFVYFIRKSEGHFRAGNFVNSIVCAFFAIIFIGGGFQTLHWFIPILMIMFAGRLRFGRSNINTSTLNQADVAR